MKNRKGCDDMAEKKRLEQEECTTLLLNEFMEQREDLTELQKGLLLSLAQKYQKDNKTLLKLFLALKKGKTIAIGSEYKYRLADGICTFQFEGEEVVFRLDTIQSIIANLTDLTEDILPLGSIVSLKMEYCEKLLQNQKMEKIWVVITKRFLVNTEDSYYTYGGSLYPIGNFNREETLQFTPSLIESVIHRGYEDGQEKAFVYLMKKELVVDKKQKSAGLAIKEEK